MPTLLLVITDDGCIFFCQLLCILELLSALAGVLEGGGGPRAEATFKEQTQLVLPADECFASLPLVSPLSFTSAQQLPEQCTCLAHRSVAVEKAHCETCAHSPNEAWTDCQRHERKYEPSEAPE